MAIDPTAPAGPSQVRWRQVIATVDPVTPGILVSPVLDRSGFVYATEFGHVIQQLDAVYGTPTRFWDNNVIQGKLCQAPALTEDGLLVLGTSGLGTCGAGRLAAFRSLGVANNTPLWDAPLDILDNQGQCTSAVDVVGTPAIRSNGRIYIADSAGRVLRFNGLTPLMEGPWPALGGGNRHAGSPLDYAWNVIELYGPGDSAASSTTASVASISPRGWAVGYGWGAWTSGSALTPGAAFWNPVGAKYVTYSQSANVVTAMYVNQWTRAENANSVGDVVGTYVGSTGSQYRAIVWPLGQVVTVNYTLLPLPSGSTTSFATAVTEDGTVVGYVQNGSTFTRVARWTKPDTTWIPQTVSGLAGDQGYAFSASSSGIVVGKARFEAGGNAPFRAFRLPPDKNIFNSSFDLWSLADTPTQREFTRSSEALEVRDDYGIVGRSQNFDGVWRAYAIGINETINNSKALGGLLAAGSGTTWTSTANSLNRLGVRVGSAQTNNPSGGTSLVNRAVIWDPAAGNICTDLNGRLPANSGWILSSAESISDSGFIVGYGSKAGTAGKVYLLYPSRLVN